MELNRERLLRAYPDMPCEVQTRMDSTLLRLSMRRRRAPMRRLTLALAAALTLLAAVGAAGMRFGVFDFMSERFGQAVLPAAQELVQRPEASIELAHTRVTLEEALYDNGRLRVVYSVKPETGVAVTQAALEDEDSALRRALAQDGVCLTGGDWLRVGGEEIAMPGDSFGDLAVDEALGVILCYVDVELGAWDLAPQGGFSVSLPVTGPQSGGRTLDFDVFAQADWQAAMRLDAGAVRATVERLSASPVRVYVRLTLERAADADDYAYENALADWRDAKLTDAGGHVLAEAESVLTVAEEAGRSVTLNFTFPPVDAADLWFAPTAVRGDDVVPDMARAMGISKGETK